MDVVRRNIHQLGGGIEIDSELGEGTSMIIRLPLTLAILDGQTVQVGSESFIIPIVSIIESLQIQPEMLYRVGGKGETIKLRGEYIPIIRLHEIFSLESERKIQLDEGLLVVVEADGQAMGLFVDDLLGQQQVVIKSLETNYKKIDGFAGATVLGNGAVALILDIPGIVRLNQLRHRKVRAA
jgi:two-component system chemotaxis sensor kinase CheA